MEAATLSETQEKQREIERKFLVASLPPDIASQLQTAPYVDIEQGYLPDTVFGKGPRVRKQTAPDGSVQYLWTLKSESRPGPIDDKEEDERKIGEEKFEELWAQTEERRIKKRRYKLPYGEHEIQLDVFQEGHLDGSMLAEVEFKTRDKAKSFIPPAWLGRDVTKETSNRKLAKGMPFPPK